MEKMVYAKLNQGIDSFLRVAMTLRRKEIDINFISMITDTEESKGIKLIIDENKTPVDVVLNHIRKLHDVDDIRVQ